MKWFNKKNTSAADIPELARLTPQELEDMYAAEAEKFARTVLDNVRRKIISESVAGSFDSLNQVLNDRVSKALNVSGQEWVESEESRSARIQIADWVRDCVVVKLIWDTYAGYHGRYVVAFDEEKLAATAPESVRKVLERREAYAIEELVRLSAKRAAAVESQVCPPAGNE
jgi:hypothetical protein